MVLTLILPCWTTKANGDKPFHTSSWLAPPRKSAAIIGTLPYDQSTLVSEAWCWQIGGHGNCSAAANTRTQAVLWRRTTKSKIKFCSWTTQRCSQTAVATTYLIRFAVYLKFIRILDGHQNCAQSLWHKASSPLLNQGAKSSTVFGLDNVLDFPKGSSGNVLGPEWPRSISFEFSSEVQMWSTCSLGTLSEHTAVEQICGPLYSNSIVCLGVQRIPFGNTDQRYQPLSRPTCSKLAYSVLSNPVHQAADESVPVAHGPDRLPLDPWAKCPIYIAALI